MKENTLQPRLLYPARTSFKYEGEIKSFSDKQKVNPDTKEFLCDYKVLEYPGYHQLTPEKCVNIFMYDGQPIYVGKGDFFLGLDYYTLFDGDYFIFGSNLIACRLVGFTKVRESFDESLIGKNGTILYQEKLYNKLWTLERISDKEDILWCDDSYDYGDNHSYATRISFDYPYDSKRTTFKQE